VDHRFDGFIKQTGLNWTAGQALGLMSLLSVVLAGGLFLWRDDLLMIALGLLLGQAIPVAGYFVLRRRQRRKIQDQLPDALFLLARTLRAGLSLEQSLTTVARHGTKPLADEFRRSADQIRLGLPVSVALQAVAERVKLADFNILVTAVNLHRTMGGNLTLLLDRVATSVRDRNQFRGYFQAATALGRLTAICVALAAPVLFVGYAIWQPDLVSQFAQSPSGMRALSVALGLEVVGCGWLYYVLRQDY
jgi:tight adherence protein B